MASTSTSSVQKSFKHDVFLSFRGEDTRKTFVDHLYHALHQKGITTYKDDERIKKGLRISDQLLRSIEESRFHIIVFSKNYASSSWCLDELVKIMECQKMSEHTAYPIFYDVEPTEVRNQIGAVGEAFARHEKEEAAKRWIDALKEAAGLAGWELKNTVDGHEAKFIQKIVTDISLKPSFINGSIDENLVGMEGRVKNVVSSLEIGSKDVRMIGIKGMGGSGKTTLATVIFHHISVWFDGTSFIENVQQVSKSSLSGLKELQKQVLSDVLNDQSIVVKTVSDGKNKMKKMMGGRKVLVVLDDVDDIDELEALAGELTWFKAGSRIIITTRDEQVLIAQRVNFIHDTSLLSNEEAICLFSRYAFGREIPIQGYQELSEKVVHYAAGLPLTIKVLGSHLCGRSEHEWVDAIERLKTIPLEKTLKRLELSYNGLENDQKEIFLDVVCILKGERKDKAIRLLESCGFNAQIGLRVLEQKSLITISDTDGLRFHDHIEEMGWNIVRRLHPDEPNRHSRLWISKEIEDTLVNDLGTEEIKCIKLEYTNLHPSTIMKGLRNMRELRCLYVDNGYREWKVDEFSQYLPDALRSLYWHNYPFQSLPKTFRANRLVNLAIEMSNISQLWKGRERKVLDKLRYLDVKRSKLRTFELGMTPNLETLDITECIDFVELQMLNECPKLKFLTLSDSKVSNLNLGMTPYLEALNLGRCNDLVELQLPVECPKLKSLNLGGSKVSNLNLGMTPHLEDLNLEGCNNFVELHLPVERPKLKSLNLSGTKVSELDLGMTLHLVALNLKGCNDFVELHTPVECPMLKYLNLRGSKVRNLNLGRTPYLERLNLSECYCLQEIKAPVGCLKKLVYLKLSGCSRFEYFLAKKWHESASLDSLAILKITAESLDICPLHPNNNSPKFQFKCEYTESYGLGSGNVEKLISFGVCACTNLESFSASICGLQHLGKLKLKGSIPEVPKDLWQLESLEELTLLMKEIEYLPDSICMLKHLKYLKLKSCCLLEQLPSDLGRLECLEELHLTRCSVLQDIPNNLCNMNSLKRLHLSYCILLEKLPEELGLLECLEELDLTGCRSLRDIPNSICKMKRLMYLYLRFCIQVEKLPEELGRLECLKELDLMDCMFLREIPDISKMKCLKSLNISYCILVEKLPEELGHLECLKELYIDGAGISRLPQSIHQLKGLVIVGSRGQLDSYGFTSITEISAGSYYVEL
ncbi:hypothetical protein L1987_64650 [Smallanthus sonchifolius]|uniref:Uncharacterized protein n=1 Tax=Smallanthus sonchifolius TaxID=185202 RepID=A0ACB9BSG8_9ASTR|nr:hypothetical protein L1987_64650 [Smallanthus sonchifolius]